MKPDRMIKYGAGIWKKWMRKVPKDMRWNEHDTRPAGRNTIKQGQRTLISDHMGI